MKVTPITNPLPGERVLAVSPPMAIQVDAGWRRRLNLYTGRTLSDVALTAEQDNRSGGLDTVAQMLSPGVLTGLEIAVDGPGPAQALHVAPGNGLTAWGEDVVVPRALRVLVTDLVPDPAQRAAQQLGILVLRPVRVLRSARFNPTDPCDVDESDDAFSDEQFVDACRLVYLPWDPSWGALASGAAAPTWQNRVAYQIFAMEAALPFGEVLPWELGGVPIGVMAFQAAGVDWVDRHAVVRAGGRAKNRAPLVPGAGNPFLWQARLQQFAEQLATQGALPMSDRIASFPNLPPAGILPRDAVDLTARTSGFFPQGWGLAAAPLPVEQLDETLDRCASLAPLSTSAGERVLVIVPVPQSVYEPALLVHETVAPIFQQRITEFVAAREQARGVRMTVRADYKALVRAVDGQAAVPLYADLDPGAPPDLDAMPDEPKLTVGLPNPAAAGGTFGVEGTGLAQTGLAVTAIKTLRTQLDHRDAGGTAHPLFTTAELADFDGTTGLAAFVAKMKSKLQQADDTLDFSFLKAQPNIYRIRQQLLGSTAATRLATSPVLATIAQGDSAAAVADQVNRFFVAVKGKAPPGTIPPAVGPTGGPLPSVRAAMAPAETAPSLDSGSILHAASSFNPSAESLAEVLATPVATISKSITPVKKTLPSSVALGVTPVSAISLSNTGFTVGAGGAVGRDPVVLLPPPTSTTVQQASPVAGDGTYDFRTVSIAQRIDDPAASEAKAYAVAARAEVLQDLQILSDLGMNVDDIPVPGVPQFVKDQPVYYPKFVTPTGKETNESGPNNLPNPRAIFPFRGSVTFLAVRTSGVTRLLKDPPPLNADEGNYFSEAVTILEHMITTLRALEGRVAAYKAEVAACDQVLSQVTGARDAASARLAALDGEVGEDRHKVATARALLADEVARVGAINARRDAVLREHVTFLAFVRPRYMEARVDTPVLPLNPGLFEAPVPACLAAHDVVPAELEQMVELLREAPVAWFAGGASMLEKLDRVELLQGTLQVAQARSVALSVSGRQVTTFVQASAGGRFAPAIAKVTGAQQNVVTGLRLQVAALDLSQFAGLGWRQTQVQAVNILSLGDLIEGNHGRSTVAGDATELLAQITRIAACLHAQACDVLPAIRLQWADLLSQYDQAVNLRLLTALPRWNELEFSLRRQLQGLADWLYAQIDPRQADGVAWMNDLVRVALLLASHAPVNEIVAGSVPTPTPATPGRTVPVTIDPSQVRLGMRVFFYRQNDVVAHGVVEDLVGTQARTRVAEALADNVVLDVGTRARFVSPDARDIPNLQRKLV